MAEHTAIPGATTLLAAFPGRAGLSDAQIQALEVAGLFALRAWGCGVASFTPLDIPRGIGAPKTMDEAFVFLRQAVDRIGLDPACVLSAFAAGHLAGSVLASVFPGVPLRPEADRR